MYRTVLVRLLFCCAACTGLAQSASPDWKTLREKTMALGLTADRVDPALDRCRRNGMSVIDTEALLRPVYTAEAELLPADHVFLKIEEGLAKQVAPERVAAAAESRLINLRQAKQLVSSAPREHGGGYPHLTMRVCMALESGLPAEVFQNIFSRPGRFRYGRMVHVIDAGETLYLAGLPSSNVQQIMKDCLDRDLSGSETLRVTDVVLQGLRDGESFESIHAGLWIPAN